MITLVVVKNPFKPQDGRKIKRFEYNGTLQDLLKANEIANTNIHATVNGFEVTETYEVKDGDFIVICPVIEKGGDKGGGKSILGIVAAVALAVVSFGVGNILAPTVGSFFGGGAAWGLASYIGAAAVMFVGSSLMGRFMGGNADLGSYDTGNQNEESTYSWNGVQTMEGQNNAIALTYGKVKSGGQTIGKYVSIVDNKEYLNWLVAAGEGELSISDIRLNDNPISNYSGVTVETRSGTNDQSVISNFNDTFFTKNVYYKLGSGWSQDVSQGTATNGLIVDISFPNGLCHINDSGGKESAMVVLDLQYRIRNGSWVAFNSNKVTLSNPLNATAGASVGNGSYPCTLSYSDDDYGFFYTLTINGGSKTILYRDFSQVHTVGGFSFDFRNKSFWDYRKGVSCTVVVTSGFVISAAQQSALKRQFRKDSLAAGEYEVRARVVYRSYSETDLRSATTCYMTGVTSIVYDDFIYPCTALIGIKALASDQINGAPSLTFIKERSTVLVWDGNSYVSKPATNPAWASYDFVHQCRRLKNTRTNQYEYEVRGARKELMRYGDFAAWAAWCDSKNLKVNIEINTTGEMLEAVNKNIANIGRGMVVRFGTKYGCIYSHKQTPVQMFGMGNIIAGSFEETFLKTSDRANAVEITFNNAAAGYERDTVTVYGDSYDGDAEQKLAQATFNGITDYKQAYREGVYQLMCNKYQLCTVSFTASIDAIACTVGDVILVAHDVPKWAHSGRIEAVDGTSVKLPCELESGWQSKSYILQWRTVKDNLYSVACTVNSSADGWTMVTLASVPSSSDPLQKGDIFDLAIANTGAKPFVVNSITRAQDFTRSIGCIEYAEALFEENYNVPVINYSEAKKNIAQNVKGLNGVQTQYCDATGMPHGRLSASWNMPSNGGKFDVYLSKNKRDWDLVKNQYSGTEIELDVAPKQPYYLRVVTVLGMTVSSGVIIGPIDPGIDELPPDVTRFDVEKMASGFRRYWWEFEYPALNDIAGFRFKYIQSRKLLWEAGIPVQEGLVTSQPFETQTIRQGAHAIMIKAVDNAGQESENFAYCLLDLGDLLEENVLFKKDFSENDWQDVDHDGIITDGGITSRDTSNQWTTPTDYKWSAPADNEWTPKFEILTAEMSFVALASGQFWIKSDIDGPGIVYYTKSQTANHWTFPKNARWTSPEDNQWTEEYDIWKQWSDRVMVDAGDIIHIKIIGLNDANKKTKINGVIAYIDVPDVEEHFENLPVVVTGTSLPIKTPHYYTTAVRLDAVQNGNAVMVRYLSRTPCQIQLLDKDGNPTTGEVDVTWQGFRKEIL